MATATNDYSKSVQFDPDGEGIDLTDMISLQVFKRMADAAVLFAGAMPNIAYNDAGDGGLAAPDAFEEQGSAGANAENSVYAPVPGGAFVYPTAVANQISFSPGPIMMFIDEPWSATGEEIATFRIDGGLLATAVGGANPRIDLVEVKLEYIDADLQTRHFEDATTREPTSQPNTPKVRQVQLTYQIKQGVAAASPAYPATTAGFIALAAIYVPTGHNAVHSAANVRDLRMPLGLRVVDVDFTQMRKTGANPWIELGGAILATAAASDPTDWVYAVCPVASPGARLLGVGLHCALGDDALAELVQLSHPASNGAATATTLATLGNGGGGPLDLAGGFSYVDMFQIMDQIDAEGALLGSRDGHRGTPVWCNGTTGGMANRGAAPADGAVVATKLALRFSCDGTGVSGPGGRASFVRFWIAEGL